MCSPVFEIQPLPAQCLPRSTCKFKTRLWPWVSCWSTPVAMGFIPSNSKACWTPQDDYLFCQTMWVLGQMCGQSQLCAWIHLHLPEPLSLWTVRSNECYSLNLCVVGFPCFPFSEGHRSINNGKTEQHVQTSRFYLWRYWQAVLHLCLRVPGCCGLWQSRNLSSRLFDQ